MAVEIRHSEQTSDSLAVSVLPPSPFPTPAPAGVIPTLAGALAGFFLKALLKGFCLLPEAVTTALDASGLEPVIARGVIYTTAVNATKYHSIPVWLSDTDFNVAGRGVWFSAEGVWFPPVASETNSDLLLSAGGAWSLASEATPTFFRCRRCRPERVSEFFSNVSGTRPRSPSNLFFVT